MNFVVVEEGSLDPDAIRSCCYAARIFPEFPSEEEIALVAERIRASEIEFWACEFGRSPRHFPPRLVGLVLGELFENSPYSLLVSFSGRSLFIWAPEDHEYLVVFGDPEVVGLVEEGGIFTFGFADYLASGNLSEKTIAHLREAAAKYSLG